MTAAERREQRDDLKDELDEVVAVLIGAAEELKEVRQRISELKARRADLKAQRDALKHTPA